METIAEMIPAVLQFFKWVLFSIFYQVLHFPSKLLHVFSNSVLLSASARWSEWASEPEPTSSPSSQSVSHLSSRDSVLDRLADVSSSCPPQLANPDSVEGLVLINIDIQARGWIDWAAQKVRLCSSDLSMWMSSLWLYVPSLSSVQLSSVTSSLTEQILTHLFSQVRAALITWM